MHLAVLAAWALTFTLVPSIVTGVPLSRLLSSDAEWYVALEATLVDPSLLTADRGFAYSRWVKPGYETVWHRGIGELASFSGLDIWTASVGVSIVTLVVFVWLIYALAARTLHDETLAFVIAAILVIPVHALAATTLGFQALGFLPRDLALTVALVILLAYFRACRCGSGMTAVFVACGVIGNFYILLFTHLCATLLVAEVIRARRVKVRHIGYAVAFVLAVLPAVASSLSTLRGAAPIDVAIMRMRQPYLLVLPFMPALETTLRRVVIYVLVAVPLAAIVDRYGSELERKSVAAWTPIALGALAVTVLGMVIENTTTLAPYQISRTSVFFLLASMMISAVGLQVLSRLWWTAAPRQAGLIGLTCLLLLQSNLPSVYRSIRDLRAGREERQSLLDAANWLRHYTDADARVLAPSTVDKDLALTLRAYSLRPSFVTEKDGGVSMVDGEQARQWLRRFRTMQETLASRDARALFGLMRSEGVTYAVLPVDGLPLPQDLVRASIVHEAGRFVVVRVL